MAKNTPFTSRILDAVYETALDLQALGVIDKHRLQEYQVLCEKLKGLVLLQKPGVTNRRLGSDGPAMLVRGNKRKKTFRRIPHISGLPLLGKVE